MGKLNRADAFLVVIDVQEKLMPVIAGAEEVERNIDRLVRGCRILDVPPLLTEQYVKGLGPTTPVVRRAFEETFGYLPIEKNCFSGLGSTEFGTELRRLQKKQALVAGVETHVCVHQTVIELLTEGYDVHLIADAISSRTAQNKEIALRRLTAEGARLSSTEMALFELLAVSGTDEFRAISRLVK